MFAKTACILISGRINSGKTTFAKLIEEELSYMDNMKNRGYYVASFATQLKYIAKNYFGWDGNKDTKGRKLLQVLGTDAGREYNEDLWGEHFN